MPEPHHSIFTGQMLFLMPNQQCQTLNAHEQKTEKAGQVKAGGRK